MAMGVTARTEWEIESTFLHPGSTLVLYTDGVVDAINHEGDMFGTQRLQSVVRAHASGTADQIQAAILDAVHSFRGGTPQFDDISLVIAKRENDES